MIGVGDAISDAFDRQMSENVEVTEAGRRAVESALHSWFSGCRKRRVPDLAQRTEQWMKRLSSLARSVEVKISGGMVTVSSSDPAGAETLELVSRGSDWFEGCDDSAALVVRALLG